MQEPTADRVEAYITNAKVEDTEALSRVFTQVVGGSESIHPTDRIRAIARFTNGSLEKKIKAFETNAVLIAKSGEQIVGFAFATCEPKNKVRIEWIGMLTGWQNTFINGRNATLMDAFMYYLDGRAEVIKASRIDTIIDPNNTAAIRLFASYDFWPDGVEEQPNGARYTRLSRPVGGVDARPAPSVH